MTRRNTDSPSCGSNTLLAKVEKTARKMILPGDSVLIGVSGGPDSVALVRILLALAPRLSVRLGIAHLNHLLRGEDSDKDAVFVAELAKALDLPCHIAREDVSAYGKEHRLSLEEAGRRVRYAFFEKIRKEHGFDKIALGHHADDNAELVLMNLLRGSGTLGLSGIPQQRDNIIRPLIRITRAEIMAFLAENDSGYVSDESNMDHRFLRNKIRHHLIPVLREYNPGITQNLNRLSAILRSEEEWIEAMMLPVFGDCVNERQDDRIAFSLSEFRSLHIAARRRLIRKAIRMLKGDIRRITSDHIETVISLTENNSVNKNLHLPDRIRIEKNNERLIVTKENESLGNRKSGEIISYNYEIPGPGTVVIREIGAGLIFSLTSPEEPGNFRNAEQKLAFFDADVVQFPLHIRNYRPGDCFRPLGMDGTQRLGKYFINAKVSKTERQRCPLVLCKQEIIWIAGHRTGEFGKITPLTQKILKAEIISGGSIF